MKFIYSLFLIPVLFLLTVESHAQVDTSMIMVQASDPLITYTGRVDIRNRNAPSFSYPGVSIRMQFTGDALDMLLQDMATGGVENTNYFTIIIDGGKPFVVKTSKSQKIYYLARSLDMREHTIEIIKRTESSVGSVIVHGFRIRRGNKLLPLTDTPTRKIEFIGNSLTAGYGNEVSVEAPPKGNPDTGFRSENENNYKAWGAVASRALKAQYVCTAYSGRGVYRNNTGSQVGTLPAIYDYINPDKLDAAWDHSRYVPDVIVMNLGSNDFAKSAPDSAAFCKTYVNFILKVKELHPNAKIICIAGNAMSDYWPEGAQHWTKIRRYLAGVVKTANAEGTPSVYYFELTPQQPPYGEDWHPTNATHQKMADAIVPFIKDVMAWE